MSVLYFSDEVVGETTCDGKKKKCTSTWLNLKETYLYGTSEYTERGCACSLEK